MPSVTGFSSLSAGFSGFAAVLFGRAQAQARRGAQILRRPVSAHGFFSCTVMGRGGGRQRLLFALACIPEPLVADTCFGAGFRRRAMRIDFKVRGFHCGNRHDNNRYFLIGFQNVASWLCAFRSDRKVATIPAPTARTLRFCPLKTPFVIRRNDAQTPGFDTTNGALAFTAAGNLAGGVSNPVTGADAGATFQHQKREILPDLNTGAVGFPGLPRILGFSYFALVYGPGSITMKSITIKAPPISRRRSWRPISSAAPGWFCSAVSSMSWPFVAREELICR